MVPLLEVAVVVSVGSEGRLSGAGVTPLGIVVFPGTDGRLAEPLSFDTFV